MARATELTQVSPAWLIWHAYDSKIKAELFSSALRTTSGVVVIDPIALTKQAREELAAFGAIKAVVVTNANHARATAEFRAEEVFVPAEISGEFPSAPALSEGDSAQGLGVFSIDGAAPGEVALHDARDGGTLVVGDAVINFEPHGFTLLPAKYCTDQKRMVKSLRRLLTLKFTRILFAHGFPVVTRAHERLAALLDEY